MNLSEHFTLHELTFSQAAARRGLDNAPTPRIVENLQFLAGNLERVRTLLKARVVVSSGYRSVPVNTAVGGSVSSQHRFGLAADFTAPSFGTPFDVAQAILASDLAFDQLIYEFENWVHISFVRNDPRRDAKTVMTLNGHPGPYKDGILAPLRYRGF